MSDAAAVHGETSYKGYWIAWVILLVLTVTMVAVSSPAIILAGIAIKATIISLWFMHLKFERMSLMLTVIFCTMLTLAVLFVLLAWDAAVLFKAAS